MNKETARTFVRQVTAGLLLHRITKLSQQTSRFASGAALKADRQLYKTIIIMLTQGWYLYHREDC